jgi:N-acetylglucosaminyldiphosphoundecaprenol N-acetyl-beta-D-mannosaminyltransferase
VTSLDERVNDGPVAELMVTRFFAGSLDEATDTVVSRALSGEGGYVVQCNVHVLMTAKDDPEVKRALNEAWCVMPDGAPVAWLMRRSGTEEAQRIGGPDLMEHVIDRGTRHRLRHSLLGSTPEVIAALERNLRSTFPEAGLVSALAPASGAESTSQILNALKGANADIVWVALGAPRQELWMRRWSDELAPALVIGVGAAFDFHAGTKARAPRWMQRAGLEWAHRLLTEPRRLSGRYVKTNSKFALWSARRLLPGQLGSSTSP